MKLLDGFEMAGSRGFYRPSGVVSTAVLSDMINAALAQARAAEVRDVVMNVVAMHGFNSPGPAYRRWAARRWAQTLGSQIRVAMVARNEHICPQKTGLLVAAEEGVDAHICETEDEAIAWLDNRADEAFDKHD